MGPNSSSDLSLLAAAAIARGTPWLRFAAPLEAAYQNAVASQRRRVLAIGLIFSVPLYLMLLWVDHEMVPDSMSTAFQIRLGVYLPLMALSGLCLLRIRSPRLREWLLAAVSATSCLLTVWITLHGQGELRTQHLVILNAIVIYTVLFGRFWPMVAMCVAVFDMHLIAAHQLGSLFTDIGVGTTLLLMANCTFMVYGCYLMEQASRTSFLVDLQEADMDAELEQATDQLARIAQQDALTGLANRRCFTDFLRGAHGRAMADGHALALVLIDVDHFKAYNDHHGHPAGDACLRSVGQALASAVEEPRDLVARWGGEEFAVVLPDADESAVGLMAERLRQAVHARGIAHDASPTAPVVTVSLGVAVLPAGGSGTLSDLIAAADKALYAAKSSGRNRVVQAEGARSDGGDACLPCRDASLAT